jgi:hypothetical protein
MMASCGLLVSAGDRLQTCHAHGICILLAAMQAVEQKLARTSDAERCRVVVAAPQARHIAADTHQIDRVQQRRVQLLSKHRCQGSADLWCSLAIRRGWRCSF